MDLFGRFSDGDDLALTSARPEPWRISSWVAMAALQKGIRRDDTCVALRAASTLLDQDPARLWRRLLGICFEDVGLAAFDRVQLVVEKLSANSRTLVGPRGWKIAAELVTLLCSATKDRSSDDLFIAATYHPQLATARSEVERLSNAEKLMRLGEPGALLSKAVIISDLAPSRWKNRSAPWVPPRLIWDALSRAGSPAEHLRISEAGYRKTREILPMMLSLLACSSSGHGPSSSPESPLSKALANELPTYAIDVFSHEGKVCLAGFLRSQTDTARWFRDQVHPLRRVKILGGLLFRVEGAVVNCRLRNNVADALKSLADEGFHGDPNLHIADAASLLATDLETLDDIRTATIASWSV